MLQLVAQPLTVLLNDKALSNGRWEQQNLRLTSVCSWSLFPLGRDISTWWCVQPPQTWRSGSAGSRCPHWCAGLSSAPLAARCKRPPRGMRNSGSTARPRTHCPRSPPARPRWTQSGTFLQCTDMWRLPGFCSFNQAQEQFCPQSPSHLSLHSSWEAKPWPELGWYKSSCRSRVLQSGCAPQFRFAASPAISHWF